MSLDTLPLLQPAYKLSTRADSVFGSLLGGLQCGECVEIAGEAGCGKSFLAATLCIEVASALASSQSSAFSGIYYIKLEDASAQSLPLIAKTNQEQGTFPPGLSADEVLSRIRVVDTVKVAALVGGAMETTVSRITSPELLFLLIQQLLGQGTSNVGQAEQVSAGNAAVADRSSAPTRAEAPALYVFDTLATVLRAGDIDPAARASRDSEQVAYSQTILRLGALLQRLALSKKAVVLVVNQAADTMTEDGVLSGQLPLPGSCCPRLFSAVSDGRWVHPAMGSVWEYCIKTKILLVNPRGQKATESYAASVASSADATGATTSSSSSLPGTARLAFVLSSNRVPPRVVVYSIGPLGARAVGEARDILK